MADTIVDPVIALDAMGGDNAPAAIVQGAVWAARDLGVQVALVGRKDVVEEELARHRPVPDGVTVGNPLRLANGIVLEMTVPSNVTV